MVGVGKCQDASILRLMHPGIFDFLAGRPEQLRSCWGVEKLRTVANMKQVGSQANYKSTTKDSQYSQIPSSGIKSQWEEFTQSKQ